MPLRQQLFASSSFGASASAAAAASAAACASLAAIASSARLSDVTSDTSPRAIYLLFNSCKESLLSHQQEEPYPVELMLSSLARASAALRSARA